MNKHIVSSIIASVVIVALLVVMMGMTFMISGVMCGLSYETSYKCHFIPFMLYIAAALFVVSLIIIWLFRHVYVTVVFSVILLVAASLFFTAAFSDDLFGIKDSYFVCDLAKDYNNQRTFFYDCMSKYAVQYDSSFYCDKMDNTIDRFMCYSKIANSPQDVQLCRMIDRGHMGYTLCYENIAKATRDPSWCSYINESTYDREDLREYRNKEEIAECIRMVR